MPPRVNILLVDDQPGRLLSYEAILAELDQNLVKAGSGVAALKALMEQEFAVILLDVSMPEMDGFETAALIHEHPRFEKTPIIFVTALQVTDMDRLKAYQLGAVDYVFVPIVPEILRSKVSVLVELYTKRRELQELNRSLAIANAELAEANSTLQLEKTRELQQLNRTLEFANSELAAANITLQTQIAERGRLELALRDADRRKDEFLAILAHELRNPLAPIRNAVQLMRQKPFPDQELSWCRDAIDRQVELLARLVDDLLDISRITQGKIKLQSARVDVKEIVARAVETSRAPIDGRSQKLEVELPEAPCHVEGDLSRLAQAVGNLLSNASKYTDDGGTIRLRVDLCRNGVDDDASPRQGSAGNGEHARDADDEPGSRDDGGDDGDEPNGDEVAIRVTDTGIGIPPEVLPRLFQLFAQVDSTLDRAQGGMGVGLALVRSLVELHGGRVSAYSEGPGKGSEFVVLLPLRPAPLAAAEPARAMHRNAPPGRRFLVVDDNVDSARSMALLLQSLGHQADTAHDGHEALEKAERIRPAVVVLDLGMPGLDGYEVARRIRAQPWGKEMLLVALTGWGQQEARDRSKTAGFDAHLVKPVEIDALLEVVYRPMASSLAPGRDPSALAE